MGDGDQVYADGDIVVVTLRLQRAEAVRLATILLAVGGRASTSRKEARRWRGIARKLRSTCEKLADDRLFRYRPSSRYENPIDMEHVVTGTAPYPVLSVRDNKTAWLQLEERGMSARNIAERLRVHSRTVVRWRKTKREGEMR